jgi:hypothetical protein
VTDFSRLTQAAPELSPEQSVTLSKLLEHLEPSGDITTDDIARLRRLSAARRAAAAVFAGISAEREFLESTVTWFAEQPREVGVWLAAELDRLELELRRADRGAEGGVVQALGDTLANPRPQLEGLV